MIHGALVPAAPLFAALLHRPEAARLFEPAALVQAMLDVEAALARARAACGLQSPASAESIAQICRVELFDLPALIEAGSRAGTVVVPLVQALCAQLTDPEALAQLHAGATSQDLIDTAMALQTRQALGLIEQAVAACLRALAALAERHPATPALARTLLQPAGVISLRLRLAQWQLALRGSQAPLRAAAQGALQLQLGGSVGSLAALGPAADAVAAQLGHRLDLRVSPLPWHTRREPWLRLATELALLCGSAAKVADDLALLSLPEVGEVRFNQGGSSSAMPHKLNPVPLMQALAASATVPARVASLLACMPSQLERGLGPWQAELAEWPQLVLAVHATLAALSEALGTLAFDPARIQAHIDTHQGRLASEGLALALAPRFGRVQAQALVARWCAQLGPGQHLRDLAEASGELPAAQLDALFDLQAIAAQADARAARALSAGAPDETGRL